MCLNFSQDSQVLKLSISDPRAQASSSIITLVIRVKLKEFKLQNEVFQEEKKILFCCVRISFVKTKISDFDNSWNSHTHI